MRAYIEAYGCALNRGEALEFESILRSSGWDIVDSPEEANLNLIATCAVIQTTENQMIKRAKHLESLGRPLVVTGCMVSALRDKIEKAAPGARFVSPDDLDGLCRLAGVTDSGSWAPASWPGTVCHTIPIASGCIGDCAYCITKIARGAVKSRPRESIISEVSRIDWSGGSKEIQLTAQDAASFGIDIATNLPALLNDLAGSDFRLKVRVGMMNPRTVLPILSDLITSYRNEKIFRFLHLPVQSASDSILGSMGRGYAISDFEKIVKTFRDSYSNITLSTDLICGYPGETKDDHRCNVELIERVRPDIVNITRFSSRPGTRAQSLGDKVPGWVAKDRSRELTDIRFRISREKHLAKVGRQVRVLVTEKGTGETMIARTDDYEQVILPFKADLGSIMSVEIVGCSPIHLIAARA